jgi:hypothetical protein
MNIPIPKGIGVPSNATCLEFNDEKISFRRAWSPLSNGRKPTKVAFAMLVVPLGTESKYSRESEKSPALPDKVSKWRAPEISPAGRINLAQSLFPRQQQETALSPPASRETL